MFRIFVLTAILLGSFVSIGQQNTMLMNTFFKDRMHMHLENKVAPNGSFLPVFESQFSINDALRDSSKQYYELTEMLFKKHLFEVKGDYYFLTISPILDFSIGTDRKDTSSRRLFQNTRGIFVEGDLFKNFSFSTSFYENQARFTRYESAHYSELGELYPNQSTGQYNTQNAVVPGSARTKPFKVDGFDYAFAVGNIVYKPTKWLHLSAGNSSHFIGDGYRSILLSDNGVPSPFYRVSTQFLKKWQFNALRTRLINLMRKPASTTVEAYYETKGYSNNYLTFQPNEKWSFSLFEGIIWSKGDSITSTKVNPLFYNPVPLIAPFVLSKDQINSVLGFNISFSLNDNNRFYGQIALGDLNTKNAAMQFGFRGFNYFGLEDFMLQVEFNSVTKGMYHSSNARLNYIHYNLPIAHVKGNSFHEFIVRSNYEWKRCYIDFKTIVYILSNYSSTDLLPVNKIDNFETGKVVLLTTELGYRFNRKMNLNLFGGMNLRSDVNGGIGNIQHIFVGLRTGINNRYTDF